MSDDPENPIPEFSHLLSQAYRASFALDTGAEATNEHRHALVALVDFVREYDGVILTKLNKLT
jgi:hypothetical protein